MLLLHDSSRRNVSIHYVTCNTCIYTCRCSRTSYEIRTNRVSSTESYHQYYKCGFWNWKRCCRYELATVLLIGLMNTVDQSDIRYYDIRQIFTIIYVRDIGQSPTSVLNTIINISDLKNLWKSTEGLWPIMHHCYVNVQCAVIIFIYNTLLIYIGLHIELHTKLLDTILHQYNDVVMDM